jgi:hypothetical protein
MSGTPDQPTNSATAAIPEEPLRGGRSTPGVVKIGATVRRPPTYNSIFVRSLLIQLEQFGFEGAPRYLGTDENARDVFSYLPGEVPSGLGEHKDGVLEAAGRLIRGFHDATVALVRSDAAVSAGLEVICHNDLSPCNAVFRGDLFGHTATAANKLFDSKEIKPQASWTWVAGTNGIFPYVCAFHPTMHGQLVVQ